MESKIQTNDIVDEQQIKVIESNGGRLCNVWIFPIENLGKLYTELCDLNIYGEIRTQPGIIDIGAPLIREGILTENTEENDVFTFDWDDNKKYVSLRYSLRNHIQLYENKLNLYQNLGYMNREKQLIMISFYKSLLQDLKALNPDAKIIETLRLSKIMEDYQTVKINGQILCFSIKKKLYEKLTLPQKYCLKKSVKQNGNILIIDECGYEKVIVSLALASLYEYFRPILIIVQNGKQNEWKQLLNEILGIKENQIASLGITLEENEIEENIIQQIKGSKVLLIIHKRCMQRIKLLKKLNLEVCIVDERISLNNDYDSLQVAKSLKEIINLSKRKIILSRAPIFAPCELISQFDRLNDHNLKELAYLTEDENIVDHFDPKMAEDFNQYIKKISEVSSQRRSEKGIVRYKIQIPIQLDTTEVNSKKRFNLVGQAKVEQICYFIQNLLDSGVNKIIVFLHHAKVTNGVKAYFSQNIASDDKKTIKQFQSKDDQKLAILSFKQSYSGINLTVANTIVFGEMYFKNPAVMLQAEGRVYQIGQKKPVKCYYLVASDDHDIQRFEQIEKNIFSYSTLIDGQKNAFKEMTLELQPIQQNRIVQEDSQVITNTTNKLREYFYKFKGKGKNLSSVQGIINKNIKKEKQQEQQTKNWKIKKEQ